MNDELVSQIRNHVFNVSEINQLIKEVFESSPYFKNISIKGEISNRKGRNISGHIYFSLKDDQSTMKCVMFKYDTLYLKEDIKDGDKVTLYGSISVYVPSGSYQFIVKRIEKEGLGDILLRKKLLIEKLNKEGLFSLEHKKQLPKFPNKIGIIVGKNSAAAKDLEFNISRRWPLAKITFYYSLVQGELASKDIISKLEISDNDENDVLILARGGGSIEDLSAFDDESLARFVYNLKTPLISAVGHEINKSIVDLVSDKYASTPTGAAELAVPDKEDVLNDLNQVQNYTYSIALNYYNKLQSTLNILINNKNITSINAIQETLLSKLNLIEQKVQTKTNLYYEKLSSSLTLKEKIINTLNPYNILDKGYSIIRNENGKVISESTQLKDKNNATIIFKDQSIAVEINKR